MKLINLFLILMATMYTTYAEYIVFKNNGSDILLINEQEYQKIYDILQIYQWPMVLGSANNISQKELDELTKPIEAAEEKFLRKKIKEISAEYDIAFIPTTIYETFVINLKESKHSLPYCSIDDIIYINKTFSRCASINIDPEISKIVKDPTSLIQDVYNYYNMYNFKQSTYQLHFIINNALLKSLNIYTDLIQTKRVQNEIDKYKTIITQLIIQSKTQAWELGYLYDDQIQKKLIDLEYEARKKNAGILYRGGRARQIYIIGTKGTEIPIEGAFLATSVYKPSVPTFGQLELEYKTKGESSRMRSWILPLNSISYGASLFAGFFCDSDYMSQIKSVGACACDYLNDPDLIGYALFIDKQKYISGKLDFLFIPSLNTITSMMASGEFFHARTKVIVPREYFIKNQGEIVVPGIKFEQVINGVIRGLIDNSEILTLVGDPLEKAKEISEFIQSNAEILKLPQNEGGFNFRQVIANSYKKAQKDLTDMLKTMITIRKYIRSKKEIK
ncbi:hypothetical protein M1446_05135 [Candidatus Dependentiae bacterium]|nr:hypothetical protein [Candidatus Dependentiae bacterium]